VAAPAAPEQLCTVELVVNVALMAMLLSARQKRERAPLIVNVPVDSLPLFPPDNVPPELVKPP